MMRMRRGERNHNNVQLNIEHALRQATLLRTGTYLLSLFKWTATNVERRMKLYSLLTIGA